MTVAYYDRVQVIVTFDANGGTGGRTITMYSGDVLSAPEVTRVGHELTGWVPELPETVPETDATYTAQWKPVPIWTIDSAGVLTAVDLNGCTDVVIPSTVKSIGRYAFRGCSAMTSVTIPEGVTSIGDSAFDGCSALASVTIPGSVTSIGNWAFSGCRAISAVHISDVAKWCMISFGSYLSNPLEASSSWPNDSCSLYVDGLPIEGMVAIPEGVVSISPCLFRGCFNITGVSIPEGVTLRNGGYFSALPKSKVRGTFPAAQIGLGIALSFAQAALDHILEFARVVAGAGLVGHFKMRFDHIPHILQQHRSALLDRIGCDDFQRLGTALRSAAQITGQDLGTDLVPAKVGEADGAAYIDFVYLP